MSRPRPVVRRPARGPKLDPVRVPVPARDAAPTMAETQPPAQTPTQALALTLAVLGAVCALAPPPLAAAGRPSAVAVPRVTRTLDLVAAYARIHQAGLRMAVPQPFSMRSLCLPTAASQSPAAGTRVAPGATVTVRQLTCYLGSPAGGYEQAAVVPDLRGSPASAAVRWAERNRLYWQLDRLPPLRPSVRPGLLDNYVVTDQQPPAGSLLARGMACPGIATGCYVATPLVMRARFRR